MRKAVVRALNEFQARAWRKTGRTGGWRERLFFAVADRLIPGERDEDGVLHRNYE